MVLLLTGAIDIVSFNVPSTTIVDIKERLSQYINSIDYAITNYKLISEIVFCENTDYLFDYSTLKEKAHLSGKKLEVLSFKGDYGNIQRLGKGFGEGEIIAYALNNSKILRKCDAFYKLTGRLIVKNMDEIVITTTSQNCFIYRPKNIFHMPFDHVETFFYKVDKNLYINHLLAAYQKVDESASLCLEHIFLKKLSSFNLQSFNLVPLISGFSASSGIPYDLGKKALAFETINYKIGVHNLKKSTVQKILTSILSSILQIRRTFK